MSKCIIMISKPGSGKGTQAEKLIHEYGLKHIVTGDLIRKEMESDSPLGQQMKIYLSNGELVPDDIVINMIEKLMVKWAKSKNKNINFLFDGFPRTIKQAEKLQKLLENLNISISSVLCLNVSDETAIKRMKDRKRKDDNGMYENRLNAYKELTEPIIKFYNRKVTNIDGEKAPDEVFKLIRESLPI